MLTRIPKIRFIEIANAAIRLASFSRRAPIYWETATLVPIPTNPNIKMQKKIISLAKPTAPVALSDMRLNINTSTVPSIIRSTESMKMGQVTANRLSSFQDAVWSVNVTFYKLLLCLFFIAFPSVSPVRKNVYDYI
ncbi:hypothetical protein D3C73_990130 [compost metagenome]